MIRDKPIIRTFLDINYRRFSWYFIPLVTLNILCEIYLPQGKIKSILMPSFSIFVSFFCGAMLLYLDKYKAFLDLKEVNYEIAKTLIVNLDVDPGDNVISLMDKYSNKFDLRYKVLAAFAKNEKFISDKFYSNNPTAFINYLKEEFYKLPDTEKKYFLEIISKADNHKYLSNRFNQEDILKELKEQARDDKKLIQDLQKLISSEEVSLRFANLFSSSEFDRNTPYIILGKFANREDTNNSLNIWIKKHKFLPLNASSYGNFPNEIAKGQTLVYIFIPDKFYRNAKDVFVKIKEYYDESGLDIERTFLAISSIFYESNFIHVGTRIKQNESLFRGLRQFLFFKTGNENFAKKIDITSELINYTDTTTFRNILKRLPLPYYLKDIKLTQKEKSNLDAMSGKFYETVKDIEEFTNLIESDRIKIFESILDKKKLKYSDADLKILNWKRKDYDKKKNIFFSERFALISGAIVKKYKAYMKRVSNTDR